MKPRIVIADDHLLVLDGLRMILEPHCEVLATVTSAPELIRAAQEQSPDVALLDIGMPNMNGIEATRQLRIVAPAVKVIVVSQYADHQYIRAAFDAGASGYVAKQSGGRELVAAIADVMAGERYVSPSLVTEALTDSLTATPVAGASSRQLTPRQLQVLQLVAQGKSAKEIAHELGISRKTVEFHKACILQTLGMRNSTELTRFAVSTGMAV
ncbi:MAG: response regulator transcription factor [Bryobacterales bacterium]|nr:response regulator transcription factor [Bryobacterales bacterium]